MKERCCARCCIVLFSLMLLMIPCAARSAGISCGITSEAGSWIPGESAPFDGVVSSDGTVSTDSITMKLSIRTNPAISESGTIIFSEVNGKKLSIRNQKDEYTVSFPEGGEIRFSGSWLLPENLYLSEVELILTVFGPDGTVLGESSASVAGNSSASGPDGIVFPDLTAPVRIMMIAAAVVWFLAAIRILIYHRRRI